MLARTLIWLRDESNRAIVKLAAAGLSALCAGLWAVYVFTTEPGSTGQTQRHEPGVRATTGSIAAGRDAVGNTIEKDE